MPPEIIAIIAILLVFSIPPFGVAYGLRWWERKNKEAYNAACMRRMEEVDERCESCGATKNLHFHMISAPKLLNRAKVENIEVLCYPCHTKEHRTLGQHEVAERMVKQVKGYFEGKDPGFTSILANFNANALRSQMGLDDSHKRTRKTAQPAKRKKQGPPTQGDVNPVET